MSHFDLFCACSDERARGRQEVMSAVRASLRQPEIDEVTDALRGLDLITASTSPLKAVATVGEVSEASEPRARFVGGKSGTSPIAAARAQQPSTDGATG